MTHETPYLSVQMVVTFHAFSLMPHTFDPSILSFSFLCFDAFVRASSSLAHLHEWGYLSEPAKLSGLEAKLNRHVRILVFFLSGARLTRLHHEKRHHI